MKSTEEKRIINQVYEAVDQGFITVNMARHYLKTILHNRKRQEKYSKLQQTNSKAWMAASKIVGEE